MRKLTAILFLLNQCFCADTFSQSDSGKDSESREKKRLIYATDFKNPLVKEEWVIEIEPEPGDTVFSKNRKLILDTKCGVTVWLNKRLEGNIQIEYKRTVLTEGNRNDRLSDLNQFWMATDPHNENLFTHTGAFSQYDSLQLYYVGVGGNGNTTTRFRKYDGSGNRVLVQEYRDEDHLLKAGKKYTIRIIVKDQVTSFWVDNECYFKYSDSEPLREGYFGFRSVHSRQEIEDFKIYQLDDR